MSTPRAKSSRSSRRLTDTLPMSKYQLRKSSSSRRGRAGSSGRFVGPYGTLDFEPQDGIFERSGRAASSRRSPASSRRSPASSRRSPASSRRSDFLPDPRSARTARSAQQPSWLAALETPGKSTSSRRSRSSASGKAASSTYWKRAARELEIDPVRKQLSYPPRTSTKRRTLKARLSKVPSRKPKSSRTKPKRSVKKARAGPRNQRVSAADLPSAFAKGDKLSRTPRSLARPKTSREARGKCKEKRCEMILKSGKRCKLCVKDGRAKYCHLHRAK